MKVATLSLALTALTVATASLNFAHAETSDMVKVEEQLRAFFSNPRDVIEQDLPKYNEDGTAIGITESPFSDELIQSGDFVLKRDSYHRSNICAIRDGKKVCVKDLDGKAPQEENDKPENIVDIRPIMKSLQVMDKKGLTSGSLEESPWSDDYWSIYKGVLGARYAEKGADVEKLGRADKWPGGEEWKKNFDFVEKYPLIVQAPIASSVDYLSPAEKYDLLVGDLSKSLTRSSWQEGKSYWEKNNGKVETWMGICHGWAPAAYMMSRPEKFVDLIATDGTTRVRFFPSDIKALSSLLWAKVNTNTQFVGGRCNTKAADMKDGVDIDRETGRILSQKCFDNNPATWHTVIVNKIGLEKASFVMDATYDYEVWNQPVYKYKYEYFNPSTKIRTGVLANATVSFTDFKKDDVFSEIRTKRWEKTGRTFPKSIVGIAMTVTYGVEKDPTHDETDNFKKDALRTVRYLYDLELDVNGQAVGGEWYSNKHPDFLWTPVKDSMPLAITDRALVLAIQNGEAKDWAGPETAFPQDWTRYAAQAARRGQPMANIVYRLNAFANTK